MTIKYWIEDIIQKKLDFFIGILSDEGNNKILIEYKVECICGDWDMCPLKEDPPIEGS